jgi:ABC-type nitrate/sulfonate/bicarbonate transport system permease component
VNRVLVNVVRSVGASEWELMKIVVLPNSVPYIIAGPRLAIGRAILGLVVGEFFGSSQGLGYMIASAATNYKVDDRTSPTGRPTTREAWRSGRLNCPSQSVADLS